MHFFCEGIALFHGAGLQSHFWKIFSCARRMFHTKEDKNMQNTSKNKCCTKGVRMERCEPRSSQTWRRQACNKRFATNKRAAKTTNGQRSTLYAPLGSLFEAQV